MSREKLIGSYLLRLVQKDRHQHFNLHNLHTGERLEFDTWVAVWTFLHHSLTYTPPDGRLGLERHCNATETLNREDKASNDALAVTSKEA